MLFKNCVIEMTKQGLPLAVLHDARIASLKARGNENLTLVARGLSNAEIADQLFVTPATAKTHVSRLLMKLDARDRAQLIVIAYESGLVSPRRPASG